MKNYEIWHKQKQKIETKRFKTLRFNEREIWWCVLGLNIGDEQDGKNDLYERPVLIFKKFNNRIALVFPLSSKIKEGKYYYLLHTSSFTCNVLLSQLRLISVKRLQRRMKKKISQLQYLEIKRALLIVLS